MFSFEYFSVISEMVVVPSNTAVMAGEKMVMHCLLTNNSAVRKWSFHNSTNAIPYVYKPGPSSGFNVNFRYFGVDINANGPATIFTNYTRLSNAGIYKCHCEIDGKDVDYSAHLIVLGKNACSAIQRKHYEYYTHNVILKVTTQRRWERL